MKSLIRYIIIFFLFLLTDSCGDFLDIQPKDRISEASFYKDAEDAVQTITSCYDPIKMYNFNINFFFFFTTFSDHGVHEQTALNRFQFNTSNSFVSSIYMYLFKGNFRCNLALEKIPPIDMDENVKKELLSQAYFLRAFYNFYLTTVFNEPPLILEVINDLDVQLTNSTRQTFKKSIVSDLKHAIDGLPEKWDDANIALIAMLVL